MFTIIEQAFNKLVSFFF